ncbi:MAG TPA: tRNA (adenosine(37)-N6)-threonylcarbamoyltransferase complex ATPase subunit type 1 TsaE [Gemmatimonadaceae bacterium]|nr:tRNA (adenosine(37)-N6)-threonylcarbamoyltransferase complex ATPase subunit type 1 TsaE [Gemmatimonadaceae bacterium]
MTTPPHHHVVPEGAARGHIALTRDELVAWGKDFGASARPPLVVAISGDLGAGKTTLVQAICAGAGVREPVTSPTFALVHRYAAATATIYHIDLYRLGTPADLTNIGWDEIVSAHAIVLVEWPERAGSRLPADVVPIDLEYDARDSERRLLLAG